MYGYDPNRYQGQPNGGWPPPPLPPPPPNNPFAVASFVLSLVSFFCFASLAIPGLVLGIIALSQFQRAPYANRWMAITGIAVSGVRLVLVVLWLLLVFGMTMFEGLWWYP